MGKTKKHTRTEQWLRGYKALLDIQDKIYKAATKSNTHDDGLEFLAAMFTYEELSNINGVLFTADIPIDMLKYALDKNHVMSAMAYRNEYYYISDFKKANTWMKDHEDFKDIRELVFLLVNVLGQNDDDEIKILVD